MECIRRSEGRTKRHKKEEIVSERGECKIERKRKESEER